MNNISIKDLFNKWDNDDIGEQEVCDLLNKIIKLLIDKDDQKIEQILDEMNEDQSERFYNLVSICSSHQLYSKADGTSISGQYQMLLPLVFYPEDYDDDLKLMTELSPMIINKYASDILQSTGLKNAEFHAYPYLIFPDELDLTFSQIFHFPNEIMNRDLNLEDIDLDISNPVTFYVYGKIFVPNERNVFNHDIEKTFENPLDYIEKSNYIKSMIEAFLRSKNSNMKVTVGAPNTVPYMLANVDYYQFITEIIMKFHVNGYDMIRDDIVAEIATTENQTSILFYRESKCIFVYTAQSRAFSSIDGERYYDKEYFKEMLSHLKIKNIMFSNREYSKDPSETIGLDILRT